MNFNSTLLMTSAMTESGISDNKVQNPLDIRSDLLPYWILCETTSAFLTMTSVYLAAVLIQHTVRQSGSRLAKRHRDSMMVRYSSNDNSSKLPEATYGSQKDDISEPHPIKIPYNEQMSVESTKSSSNLIAVSPISVKPEFNFNQRAVIAVHRMKEKDQGRWLLRSIVLCVLMVVIRCIAEQSLILLGNWSDLACDVLTKVMITFTAVSLHCCHVFLWLRQLTFYSNPVLKPLRSKKLKILSYAAYAVMPLTLAVTLALYMWWRDYITKGGYCVATRYQNLPSYIPFSVLVVCTVTIQILLSSLFLYPLIVHKIRRRNSSSTMRPKTDDSASENQSTAIHSAKLRKSDKLMACIKRVLQGATVGITTDVAGGVVSIFLPDDIPIFALSVLYNLNVSLNLLCLIYTYANWRQMLFPWCCRSQQEKEFRNSKRRKRPPTRRNGERFHRDIRRPSQKGKTVLGTKYTSKEVDN